MAYYISGDRYGPLLQRFQQRYNQMLSEMAGAKGAAATPISADYTELVDLFRPGGNYGAGQKALIEQEAKKGSAAALSNLIKTGMSSGTNAAGVATRIARDVTTAKLGVEDERIRRLAEALLSRGGAAEARIGRMTGAYGKTGELIAQMATNEPTYQSILNPYVGRTATKQDNPYYYAAKAAGQSTMGMWHL
jgi:hypothetical protein